MEKPNSDETAKPPTSAATTCNFSGRPPQPCAQIAGEKVAAEVNAGASTTDTSVQAAGEHLTTNLPNTSECRRSSRKKTLKYDVRDLFHKSRKPEKVQILARIDCNASSASSAVPNNRPFTMLDGSSIAAAGQKVAERTPPIFIKPQPTQGRIEERVSTAPVKAAQQPLPCKRGRGRPRKLQPDGKGVGPYQDSDTNSSTPSSYSTTTNASASGESDACAVKMNPKTKLRVCIKRMTMPVVRESESSASCESLKSSISLQFYAMDLSCSSQEGTVMKTIDEQHEAGTNTTFITTETAKSLQLTENDNSISTVPFVEKETAMPKGQIILESVLSPKKEQKPLEMDTVISPSSTNDDEDVDKQQLQKTGQRKSQQEQKQKVVVAQTDCAVDSLSPSASPGVRRSNRSRILFGSSNMTLEQTFAEIAAASSELAQSYSSESSSELETPKLLTPDQLEHQISSEKFVQLENSDVPKDGNKQTSVKVPNVLEDQNALSPKEKKSQQQDKSIKVSDESHTLPIANPTAANSSPKQSANNDASKANQIKLTNQIVESDALINAIDKACAQMRSAAKSKKKNNLNAKEQTDKMNTALVPILKEEPEQVQSSKRNSYSPTAPIGANKKLPSSSSPRRHTICADRAINMNKRQSPDRPRSSSNNKKPNPKKQTFSQLVAVKQENLRDSIESSSSISQSAFAKASETLQATLTENSSCDSTSSGSKLTSSCGIPTPTTELAINDPLDNIVKLLDPASEEQKQQPDLANIITPEPTPLASPQVDNTDSIAKPSSGGGGVGGGGGVRRSRRIKKKRKFPKGSFPHGVVVKRSDSPSTTSSLSMGDQLTQLALIEVINLKFLISEGLNNFQMLRESYYRCARQVSRENAEMQCDCFPNGDDESMGQTCCGDGCINRMLMIECGPLCSYKERCTNKRFQMHQCWPCRVFRTEKKGCGITAEIEIPSGQFIMEYLGEVIDNEEFERRRFAYSRNRNPHYYFMALRGDSIIDATAKGNISRYINHSCDPNAETQKWTVNGELRIGFFSIKPIMAGEEITFNYQYQRYGTVAQRCYCETAKCSGWVGCKPNSDEVEQLHGDTDSEEIEEPADELDEQYTEQEQDRKNTKKVNKSKYPKGQKQPHLTRKQRREYIKAKDREYKAGRWLRPSGSGNATKSVQRKPEKLEDADVLDQLSLLNRKGLKNQADTLRFSRCMVRATQLQTRLQLLGVLTRGELPCRRLFLDYHGLRLLHAWISESGSDKQLRQSLLEAFESLPIPNKTMLNDSRVYHSVQLWSENTTANTEEMSERLLALLKKWNALPEIFRIPKRERIEQMKEHERQADGQQKAAQYMTTALEDSNSNSSSTLHTDRYRQDRFRRDTVGSRYEKPKPTPRMSGNNTVCTITTTQLKERNPTEASTATGSGNGNGNTMPTGIIKAESRRKFELANAKLLRRSLFEKKVAQDEAEKRASSEDRREHEVRCEYFGADPSTDPKQLPFYQNTETNEWFNSDDVPVPTPKRCGNGKPPKSKVPVEYRLPAGVEPLPDSWHYGVTQDGDIYYYNIQDRVSQWEPPNAQQRLEKLIIDEEPNPVPDPDEDDDLLVKIDSEFAAGLSDEKLEEYIQDKVCERRQLRHNRLVSVRTISPRREEDRIYNQIEARKYKENKEKIRRRKEIYRRTGLCDMHPVATNSTDPLPIQGYLYSSDDDDDDEDGASANVPRISAPSGKFPRVSAALQFPDGMFAGRRNWQLESRSYTTQASELNFEPSTSKSALAPFIKKQPDLTLPPVVSPTKDIDTEAEVNLKRTERERRNRSERERMRRKPLSSTSRGREQCEKFRFEISGIVAEYLRPYRRETCQEGRITSEEDYKFLIKRLSHHITTKEMRYCDMNGNSLSCTDSVRHKSYDFIKSYMRERGPEYTKPENEYEF